MARTRDDAKWAARQDEIVDIAARLFAAQGYHSTGVQEVGDAAGLGRGALYYYVTSKENLLGLIHTRVMEHVLASAERARTQVGSASERLTALGHELINIICTYPDHVWVFLHEFRVLTGEESERFLEQRRRYEGTVAQILRDGIGAGEFDIANVRLTALAWLGLHNYIYIWFDRGGQLTPAEIADTFGNIFLNGIRTRSG